MSNNLTYQIKYSISGEYDPSDLVKLQRLQNYTKKKRYTLKQLNNTITIKDKSNVLVIRATTYKEQ